MRVRAWERQTAPGQTARRRFLVGAVAGAMMAATKTDPMDAWIVGAMAAAGLGLGTGMGEMVLGRDWAAWQRGHVGAIVAGGILGAGAMAFVRWLA